MTVCSVILCSFSFLIIEVISLCSVGFVSSVNSSFSSVINDHHEKLGVQNYKYCIWNIICTLKFELLFLCLNHHFYHHWELA
jgi:hypothetical protein